MGFFVQLLGLELSVRGEGAMSSYDVAVIGGGVVGLSVAYFLAPRSSVVVLEREDQLGYHSSGRSAAMYIEGYENPTVQKLTLAGKDFFFDPPEDFSEYALLSKCGGLTIAGPQEVGRLEAYCAAWSATCPDLRRLNVEQTTEIVPIIDPSWLSGAAFDPSWHSIDVHGLLTGFERGVRAGRGEIKKSSPVTKITRNGRVWELTTPGEVVEAEVVVNAAGAWANAIAALAGVEPKPLVPLRRTAAIVPGPEQISGWPMVHTVSGNLYFKPESPGLMVCPQDETPAEAIDAFALEVDVAMAIEQFQRVTSHRVGRVISDWAGLRTFTDDRMPVVGFAQEANNFFWLAGQGGFGVQTAPGLGSLASRLILSRDEPDPKINANRYL